MIKKTTFLFAFAFMATSIFAQVITSKKGEHYLPQAGDWAISIDGNPFLNYVGNFIGGDGSNDAPRFDFLSGNQTIIGKYFADSVSAYRVGILIGYRTNSNTSFVPAIPATTPSTNVENETKNSGTDVGLTFGKEWRKGTTRLQGFYGAEAGVGLNSGNIQFTYGNDLSASNPSGRMKEIKTGSVISFGVRGFVGAEYFILPKIALGGEFGWGLVFLNRGEGSTTVEYWSVNKVDTQETKTGKSSSFSVDSDNLNSIFGSMGAIRLTLHF